MGKGLARLLRGVPVIDVHERHMPSQPGWKPGLLQLLQESYAGWTQSRPYPLPNEPPVTLASASDLPGSWAEIAPIVEGSGTNAAVRSLVRALCELYGVASGQITQGNYESLDREIRRRKAGPAWHGAIMDRAGIRTAVSDPYLDPLLDVRRALGERYRSVMRINALAFGWHPEARDHNGNNGQALLGRLGLAPASFDEYLEALPLILDRLPSLNKLGLKNALAYDRSVDFDLLDPAAARQAWGKPDPDEREKKAFGDCVVDRLCRLAGERDIPVQMHLGSALIRGSRPLRAAGLIERHPRTPGRLPGRGAGSGRHGPAERRHRRAGLRLAAGRRACGRLGARKAPPAGPTPGWKSGPSRAVGCCWWAPPCAPAKPTPCWRGSSARCWGLSVGRRKGPCTSS